MKFPYAAVLLLCLPLTQNAAACASKALINLELTATGRQSALPEQIVIGTDGCVSVVLDDGARLRTLQLTSGEIVNFQNQINALPVNSFDSAYIRGQVSSRTAGKGIGGVINADRHSLSVRSGGLMKSIAWYGLYFDQQRYPDIVELSALATLSRNVRALTFDTRLQDVTP